MGVDSPRKVGRLSTSNYRFAKFLQTSAGLTHLPTNETAILFEKILKSMKLTLEQAMHIEPERLAMLGEHQLEWVWFAGCESNSMENAKQLTSPLLQDIDGKNEQKRALWQQICSYS